MWGAGMPKNASSGKENHAAGGVAGGHFHRMHNGDITTLGESGDRGTDTVKLVQGARRQQR